MKSTVDWSTKGLWLPAGAQADAEFAAAGHGLFDGPFGWPVMVARRTAVEANIATMAAYCARHDLDFAPHGKTTMAPTLFAAQLAAGAWGITVATANQALAARKFGVPRVLVANELLDPRVLRWAAQEDWDFLCYVDSLAGVEVLRSALDGATGAALRVLVELGYPDGRTGCRSVAEAADVAAAASTVDGVTVAGVAGFEGMLPDRAAVRGFLDTLVAAGEAIDPAGPFLLSAGGSAFFDTVVEALTGPARAHGWRVVLRSGAVVSHDNGYYAQRTPFARIPEEGSLSAALEMWAQVLSTPEPGLAILGAGKRDLPFDLDLPVPLTVRDARGGQRPLPGARVSALNDQHAYLRDADVIPGELVRLGVSHPCTAFDKWRVIPVVDDQYTVVDLLHTYF
jgi:D-serine deaminase-like pyridoxal phosphate-dependent protein